MLDRICLVQEVGGYNVMAASFISFWLPLAITESQCG